MQPRILITGVGKRIGLYLAKAYLARGYQVIGTFRRRYPSLVKLELAGADLYQCDFTQADEIEKLIQAVIGKYQHLDAIIHNASLWLTDDDPIGTHAIMEQVMQVHVSAPYRLNLAFAPLLINSPQQADIIHITDFVAQKGSQKHIAYAASKAALENLTLSFAAKYAPKIKVNSIAPALICFNENDDDAYKQKARGKSLLQREGGENEVLQALDYLLQSHYITGRSLPLDGGRHLK
ncbi:dihydromonapterin reductase [Shewanella sp. AS1]|uniref:dihydromonapterin reductase n=1 Tax=Shewanella sp. AS1 TaxID=2907626 RepID=UPI001F4927C8|nr:dihydromonapterin reductase [Shewanella sp. AS1]MCE9679690.1 dihydromonapterin reductase [Shewanella sp. AS1]